MSEMPQESPRKQALVVVSRWAAIAFIVVFVAFGFTVLRRGEAPKDPVGLSAPANPSTGRRETRATLDPAQFVGKAAAAHRIARAIPDVLDQLYCYCGCDKHQGHKSLLSCYTDSHAAT